MENEDEMITNYHFDNVWAIKIKSHLSLYIIHSHLYIYFPFVYL